MTYLKRRQNVRIICRPYTKCPDKYASPSIEVSLYDISRDGVVNIPTYGFVIVNGFHIKKILNKHCYVLTHTHVLHRYNIQTVYHTHNTTQMLYKNCLYIFHFAVGFYGGKKRKYLAKQKINLSYVLCIIVRHAVV